MWEKAWYKSPSPQTQELATIILKFVSTRGIKQSGMMLWFISVESSVRTWLIITMMKPRLIPEHLASAWELVS